MVMELFPERKEVGEVYGKTVYLGRTSGLCCLLWIIVRFKKKCRSRIYWNIRVIIVVRRNLANG